MTVVGLDHVQLAAPPGCEDDARRFFGGLLGLAEIPKPEQLQGRGGIWFRCGAQEVHIGVEQPFSPARKAHPALRVADYAALLQALDAAGVEARPDETIPGVRRCFVADPWGNRLELVSAE